MEMMIGSCRLGLWYVLIQWEGTVVHRVRFVKTAQEGPVPERFIAYLAGKVQDLHPFTSPYMDQEGVYADIYRAVSLVRYGSVATYGEIAARVGTSPRVVGNALAKNITPLVIPCHRIVSAEGMGNFTPSPEIKRMLLDLEASVVKQKKREAGSSHA